MQIGSSSRYQIVFRNRKCFCLTYIFDFLFVEPVIERICDELIISFVNLKLNCSFSQKAVNNLKLESNSIALANLGIYRWAHQAVDTPVEHPLFPLIWQQFMLAYLGRTVASSGLVMLIFFHSNYCILPFKLFKKCQCTFLRCLAEFFLVIKNLIWLHLCVLFGPARRW